MVTTALKLDLKIVEGVEDLFLEAKNALARGDADAVARFCKQAWQRVPEPKFQWDFSYSFLDGLVTYLRPARRNYDELAKIIDEYITSQYFRADEYGPYFWLGTLAFERGDTDAAHQYFEKADKLTGGRCFADEDLRYKKFYRESRAARKTQSRPS